MAVTLARFDDLAEEANSSVFDVDEVVEHAAALSPEEYRQVVGSRRLQFTVADSLQALIEKWGSTERNDLLEVFGYF